MSGTGDGERASPTDAAPDAGSGRPAAGSGRTDTGPDAADDGPGRTDAASPSGGQAHAHGHAEGHGPAESSLVDRAPERRRLATVLLLTTVFLVVEFAHNPPTISTTVFLVVEIVGGLWANSLALLADAGHMFTDVAALGLSFFAMSLAERPPSTTKTYGYVRIEILAALVNGAALLLISLVIFREAWLRVRAPEPIDGPVMLAVAVGGLIVNVVGAVLLHRHAHDNLNLRGAYLHVIGDLLGSIGAIVAAVLVVATGWTPADPIVSALIGGLILASAWRLVRDATDVLMEAAPSHIDVETLLEELEDVEELSDVHDLHVWTLTSGFVAMSGHGVIDDPAHHRAILDEIQRVAERRGIRHVTFQLEPRTLVQIPRPEEA